MYRVAIVDDEGMPRRILSQEIEKNAPSFSSCFVKGVFLRFRVDCDVYFYVFRYFRHHKQHLTIFIVPQQKSPGIHWLYQAMNTGISCMLTDCLVSHTPSTNFNVIFRYAFGDIPAIFLKERKKLE